MSEATTPPAARERVLLVGTPNVGKSALFNRLTGQHVTVSNYPGTTVEIATGRSPTLGRAVEVVDTPGMYSLLPITAEERVASDLLFGGGLRAVVHVIDAKNLPRMLGMTLQFIEARLPVALAVNMMDEARALGIEVDVAALERALGIPVAATVSVTGEGVAALAARLRDVAPAPAAAPVPYGSLIERALAALTVRLEGHTGAIAPRAWASLLLQGDDRARERLLVTRSDAEVAALLDIAAETRTRLNHSPHYYITLALRAQADRLVAACVRVTPTPARRFKIWLDRLCTHPLTGYPILVLVIYLTLIQAVGHFAAGTLVGWLEHGLFERWINPWIVHAAAWLPWPALRDLIAGDYGIVTLGLRYALAIILPIVGVFFLVFALLEDSGYLPRMALLVDRLCKPLGLNGRAVIPLALGVGCDTMATLVTRTLETRRERVLCIFLLALGIPCSAQLGVILGLLAHRPAALAVWALVVTAVSIVAAMIGARLLPGAPPRFFMELPPLRRPSVVNVLGKTGARMVWYLREILPAFLLASVLIWVGQITGLFAECVRGMQPAMHALGLPDGTAVAFLFGFFRRDYGAAGLYDLHQRGALDGNQIVIAAITLTLFLPCIAQFLVMRQEQGWRTALAVALVVLAVAFGTGFGVHAALAAWGGSL